MTRDLDKARLLGDIIVAAAKGKLGRGGVTMAEELVRLGSALKSVRGRMLRYQEALKQIAEHPHQAYDHPSNESQVANYGAGCADGHRCAANSARAALAQGMEARQGGDASTAAPVEDRQPDGEADAPRPHPHPRPAEEGAF